MVIKLPRLNRSFPVRQEAADVVQDAIMKGLLRPGENLRQRTLALQFKRSHSAVREVLLELERPSRKALVALRRIWRDEPRASSRR